MDVKQLLIDTVSKFGYPVFLQGSLAPEDAYPASFFTFWNNDTPGSAFYDNSEREYVWDFDLNFYSNDPDSANSKLFDAVKALRKAGFIGGGKGHDAASDEPTHTGRGTNVYYIERGGIND